MVDVTEAHAQLVKDASIQFRFPAPAPPTPPPEPPAQLPDLASIGQWLFWIVIGAAVVALAVILVQRARGVGPRMRRTAAALPPEPDEAAVLGVVPAAALHDADALAARGDYGGAIHALLLRGVGAIQQRFPRTLVPAHTSRDIASLAALPAPLRSAFADIAGRVELAVFAQRPLGRAEWEASRARYAGLLPPGEVAP